MKILDEEFHFDFDACPYPRPAGFDGLIEEWGISTWCNPPLDRGSSLSAWVHKAILEAEKGKTVVLVLPMPRWVRDLLKAGAKPRPIGPVHWMDERGRHTKSDGGNHYPDTLFILRGAKVVR